MRFQLKFRTMDQIENYPLRSYAVKTCIEIAVAKQLGGSELGREMPSGSSRG
jgi:hypothetical protein